MKKLSSFLMLGSRQRPTIKTKNNKTELLNPEEGEDNMGDAVGKKIRGMDRCMKGMKTHKDYNLIQSILRPVISRWWWWWGAGCKTIMSR